MSRVTCDKELIQLLNIRDNKIRDLCKVKLYTIRSETKKERERDKHMLTLALKGGA